MTGKASLTTTNHDRHSAGLMYVYPVISRRAGGLSIGINLNPNNACNWRCVYCQVPDLTRGGPPRLDKTRFVDELDGFLGEARSGALFERYDLPEAQSIVRDISISGNGEPTAQRDLEWAMATIAELQSRHAFAKTVQRVMISNGSLVKLARVQNALRRWNTLVGEVWFKVDAVTSEGMRTINQVYRSPAALTRALTLNAELCTTRIQSCFFAWDGEPPRTEEVEAYLRWLRDLQLAGTPISGVMLYGVARPSMQPEATRISALPPEWFESLRIAIESLGFPVSVTA